LIEDEHVKLDEIHEVIGIAATWLMKSFQPIKARSIIMVLRAREAEVTDCREKSIYAAARQMVMNKMQ